MNWMSSHLQNQCLNSIARYILIVPLGSPDVASPLLSSLPNSKSSRSAADLSSSSVVFCRSSRRLIDVIILSRSDIKVDTCWCDSPPSTGRVGIQSTHPASSSKCTDGLLLSRSGNASSSPVCDASPTTTIGLSTECGVMAAAAVRDVSFWASWIILLFLSVGDRGVACSCSELIIGCGNRPTRSGRSSLLEKSQLSSAIWDD